MTAVSRFGANLLRLLHGIWRRAPLERVLPLLTARLPRPECLRPEAVMLIQGTLAKGAVWLLARQGWRRERFLRGGQVRAGRLWERTSPESLALAFSKHAMELLIWLTASAPEDETPDLPFEKLTAADRWLAFVAYQLLRATELGKRLRRCEAIHRDGLCRLAFAEDFASETSSPDWGHWTTGLGSCILEALQAGLAERWFELERSKGGLSDARLLRDLGNSQERALTSLATAVSAAGRYDLARFLLVSGRRLLENSPGSQLWIGALNLKGMRLAERTEVFQAALVFLRHLAALQQWERAARTVGYFDEGYAASQLWKADWERYDGEELCRRAEIILREIEPL